MSTARVVLASGSPRRRELLGLVTDNFVVTIADVDETPGIDEEPAAYVQRLAYEKACSVASPGDVVIGADTTVVVDGNILGKPVDPADAARMLRRLSGRTHEVLTGVAVVTDTDRRGTVVRTVVEFCDLSDDDIDWYVATQEPLDKAGAYGLQGIGGVFVRSIAGSVHNVIGLPIAQLRDLLRSVGSDWRSSESPAVTGG